MVNERGINIATELRVTYQVGVRITGTVKVLPSQVSNRDYDINRR